MIGFITATVIFAFIGVLLTHPANMTPTHTLGFGAILAVVLLLFTPALGAAFLIALLVVIAINFT